MKRASICKPVLGIQRMGYGPQTHSVDYQLVESDRHVPSCLVPLATGVDEVSPMAPRSSEKSRDQQA